MESFPSLEGCFRKIHVEFDAGSRSLWVAFASDGVPSFTVPVLDELHALCDRVAESVRQAAAGDPPVRYLVLTSRIPGMFNMGGDLGLIAELSRRHDRDGLDHYGRLTADMVHRMWNGLDVPLVTIAAVDGNAFGGGFEAALSTQFLVAGPRARFAFPETRFGLFPGMGATSLVARRASEALAERLILDAATLDADRALELGLCDRVLNGASAVDFVRRAIRRGGERLYLRLLDLAAARMVAAPYSHVEARGVVGVWADAVLRLSEPKRRHIDKIVAAQRLRVARLEPGANA